MTSENSLELRVAHLAATGVLGEYDHKVTFGDPDDFAIIYGPNGVGKTRFLEVIDALAKLRADLLAALPFKTAEIAFSDGTMLSVKHDLVSVQSGSDSVLSSFENESQLYSLRNRPRNLDNPEPVQVLLFGLMRQGKMTIAPPIPTAPFSDRDPGPFSSRRERLPQAARREFDRLVHRGEVSEARLFIQHFERGWGGQAMPDDFPVLADTLDLHLIATQRLLTMDLEGSSPSGRKESASPRPTIEQYSDTVRDRLETDLSENSRLSQRLDSIFPRLMLERHEKSDMSSETIRTRLEDQSKRRARIQQITPLGIQHELPLPEGDLTPGQRSVLELYAEHAEQKLATFADTIEKIDLLEKIVNSRLHGKALHINADDGLIILRLSDGERIPLAALSSGEQHEIILMFDLLFNVKPGGLVLIDEPEISLHIAWQKRFIPDVLEIAKLVGFQFVIATHSPQIIDGNWRYAQRLGPKTAAFDEADTDA